MISSKSSPKRDAKASYKPVTPFDMFYQLTYMSAMSSAGISRSKTFEIAAQSKSSAAPYFKAVNTLVNEFRYDYPDACRIIGQKGASENIRTFLLRLSDALRSGEPLGDFLTREADVQGEDYKNAYERSLENLKQWTNAFSSITISVGLIIIIQMITSMIYSSSVSMMAVLVFSGAAMAGFGAWIIYRSAPREVMNVAPSKGSREQRRALRLFRMIVPVSILGVAVLLIVTGNVGLALIIAAACLLPVGVASLVSDRITTRKDVEFSTFLRSTGSMATSSGTTLKQALTKIDLDSFPTLGSDIERLGKRLQARIAPQVCWHNFGVESGSRLISDMVDIFYGAVNIGGDPERVGYICSLFSAKVTQLRAKRRLVAGTFSGLTTVMQIMVAMLMIFVLSVVNNFAVMVATLAPEETDTAMQSGPQMSLGLAEFSQDELAFLGVITVLMVTAISVASSAAVMFCDGGLKLKVFLYLALTIFISGLSFLIVPGMVAGILKA
ncbi:MAG: type II secretion system F family protein [Chloroflexota bacterium]|nr:type II secretion system F family protein [Chloroflexota bacterium]